MGRAFRAWLGAMEHVGAFNTRLLLTVFYFTVLMPFAAVVRLFTDPFSRRGPSGWLPKAPGPTTLDEARRQS